MSLKSIYYAKLRLFISDRKVLFGTGFSINSITSGWPGPKVKDLTKEVKKLRSTQGRPQLLLVNSQMLEQKALCPECRSSQEARHV